jgi:hypothetical protein
MPARRTELVRRTPLAPGGALRRVALIRRRRLPADPVWSAVRSVVWERCGGRCERCGTALNRAGWQCHHRKFRSRGGRHSVSNAVALCSACHTGSSRAVHRDLAGAAASGYAVSALSDPALVPVRLFDGRLVRLGHDGTYIPVRPEELRPAQLSEEDIR